YSSRSGAFAYFISNSNCLNLSQYSKYQSDRALKQTILCSEVHAAGTAATAAVNQGRILETAASIVAHKLATTVTIVRTISVMLFILPVPKLDQESSSIS